MPFTLLGTASGIVIAGVLILFHPPRPWTEGVFWSLHPLHIFLSAVATTGLYRRWARAGWLHCFVVGYLGAIGIATLSDCVIPYAGEWMLDLPNRGWHIGFLEMWWLVNPAAFGGIAIAWLLPDTTCPHTGHVLVSTWASLFHIQLALGADIGPWTFMVLPIFLFMAVWLPCCTSDVVLPVLFSRVTGPRHPCPGPEESECSP